MTTTNTLNYIFRKFNSLQRTCCFAVFLLTFLLSTSNSWGQIAQRGSSTTASANSTNSTTITIDKPSGVVAGDVLLFSVVQNETDNDNGGLTSPTLSGWTLVKDQLIRSDGTNNGNNAWFGSVYYRVSDGSEGNSFTFAMNSRCDMAIGSMVAFSGVACNALKPDGSAGGPFDITPGSFNNADSSTATATGVTVANNSAVIMFAMCKGQRSFGSWSNSQAELFDNGSSNGDAASVGAAWLSSVNSGATGNRTVTLSSSDRNSAILLVLRRATTVTVGAASSNPTLCINTALTNITCTTTGATGIGTATGLPAGVTAAWASNRITISGTPTASGTFSYSIPLTVSCGSVNATGTITVTAANTAGTASSTPTLCIDTALTNITRTTTGATGIGTATGLPSGVTAAWASNTITISGTPTASGTFDYSIPLTGGCGTVSATGTINVINVAMTAAAPSSSPTLRINSALTNITHTTTGATGIGTATGLPSGVTAAWASNTITISGTPTAEGIFNYSIPLTGGCNSVNATGTITVVTYKSQFVSAELGSPNWCPGETRQISVTIKNVGSATWADGAIGTEDINVGVKWNTNGGNWADYHVRTDAGGLAPGETGTFTFTLTAANNTGSVYTTNLAAGTNNITFDLVYEGISWFAGNGSGVGPGNTVFRSSNQTINTVPTAPSSPVNGDVCVSGAVTISATAPAGTTIDWYAASTGGSVLTNGSGVTSFTTPGISTTTIYYAESRNTTTGCVSASRTAITATINEAPSTTGVSICAGGTGSLSATFSSCPNLTGQTSGPKDATSGTNVTGVGSLAWTNPGNIAGAGTAGMSVAANTTTNYLRGTGYGFAIPSNAIINGIQLSIRRSSSSTSTSTNLRDVEVKLVKNGTIEATNKASATFWGNLNTATYGGVADLWSGTWAPEDINNSNFGAVLSIINTNTGTTSRTAAVDWMQITVTYTIPGSLQWYTVSSGGTAIGSGNTFDPVGVANSGIADTNTAGTTSYWVECTTSGGCRVKADFIINPAPTVTSAAGNSKTYTGIANATTVSAVASDGATIDWYDASTGGTLLASGTLTYAPTAINVGTYTVYAQARNTTSVCTSAARTSATLTIIKATLTATLAVSNSPATYSGSAQSATVDITSSSVEGTVTTILTGGSATQTNAGTYQVTANFVPTDSDNYDTLTGLSAGNFVINKAIPTATLAVSNSSATYSGSAQSATVDITTSSVEGTVTTISTGGSATQTNVGTYEVTASFVPTDSANYDTLTGLSAGNFAINKATPTATLAVSNSPSTYSGSAQSATVDITSSSVEGTVTTILTGGSATQTNAGTYEVTASFVPTDSDNYDTLTGLSAGNFVINKAIPTATLAVSNSPATYSGSAQSATVDITTSSVEGTVTTISTGGSATQTNVGTYEVTASFVPTDSANYDTLTVLSAGNFAINKATPTATLAVSNSPSTYSGSAQSATVDITTSSVAGTVTTISTGGSATQTNVGTYEVTASFVPTDSVNYNTLTDLSAGNFIIVPAALTITADNDSKCFGDEYVLGTTTFTSIGLVSPETIESVTLISSGADSGASAGSYSIVPSAATGGTFLASNYAITYTDGTLTVNPTNTVGTVSSTPTLCLNTLLTEITHATTGATGIGTATNLPDGVTATFASDTITISGTPTVVGTFNYTIPLTGGCGSENATGTITVTADSTASTASSTPTLCLNTALTEITHATTGATGIGTATNLPDGVTATFASDTITINGTPTVAGTFNYTIPLTGGCGSVNATGTIIVGDFTAPVLLEVPADTAASCTTIPVAATPTVTDNCDTSPVVGLVETSTQVPTGIGHYNYTITRTWTATDESGNISTQTQNIVVTDTTVPVADVVSLAPVTGECSAIINSAPTATDNCSGKVIGTTTDSLTRNTQGISTVTWTFTDGAGNTSTQTQNIVVTDTISPVPDVAVLKAVTGLCSATITSAPTATDNCNGTIVGTTSDSLTRSIVGTSTVTWTFTDAEGNTSTQTQDIIVPEVKNQAATLSISDTSICKYIGTTDTITFTTNEGASSYNWEVTSGITIISGQGTNILVVDLHSATVSGIIVGYVSVETVTPAGCYSIVAKRYARLSVKFPTVPSSASLKYNGVAISNAAHFVGDASKTLVLAATDDSGTANYYKWKLPAGVNVVSGNPDYDKEISINLGGVAPANTVLSFEVNAVANCGYSGDKILQVIRTSPRTPSALSLTNDAISSVTKITNVSTYIGAATPLTLTATPYTVPGYESTSYKWVLPSGIAIVEASATLVSEDSGFKTYTSTSNVIRINLSGVRTATSLLLKVYGVNGNGESPLSEDLTLTAAVPAAPAALKLTNNAVSTTLALTNVSTFIGTSTPLTLTATASLLATSYEWELPAGVNLLSGATITSPGIASGISNVITVDFADVAAGTSSLFLGAKGVNGAGASVVDNSTVGRSTSSTARLLRLIADVPVAPAALKLTNDAVSTTLAITNISIHIGTSTPFTLTATASALATSYEWELPAGVNLLSGAITTSPGNASGISNVITVNFADVAAGTSSLYLGAKGVNGAGVSVTENSALIPSTLSTARLLRLSAAVAAAPAALRLTNDAVSTTLAITNISKFIGTSTPLKLTATASVLATSYQWELPAGVNLVSGATVTSTGIASGSSNVITVNFADVTAGTTGLYIGVKGINGVGVSVTNNSALIPSTLSTARLLRVTSSVPAAVATVAGQIAGLCGGISCSYTMTASALANSYVITAPAGSVVRSASNMSNNTNVLATSDLTFTVLYPEGFASTTAVGVGVKSIVIGSVNGVGTSLTNRTIALSTLIPAIGAVTSTTTGVTTFNQGLKAKVFTVPAVFGAIGYNWTVANGAVIVGASNTNSITVDFSAVPTTIRRTIITVSATTPCGTTAVKTITLNFKAQETVQVNATEVYPNPVSDNFNIDITASKAATVEISVYSTGGVLIVSPKSVQLQEGRNTITENVSSLNSGIHILRLVNSSNGEVITKTLIKN